MVALVYFFLGLTAVYFSPEYLIWETKIWSSVAYCGFLALCTTIYWLFLYPEFFTLLKHIKTPSVSDFDLCSICIMYSLDLV